MRNSWAAAPSSCKRNEGADCTNIGVKCRRQNCVWEPREFPVVVRCLGDGSNHGSYLARNTDSRLAEQQRWVGE